MFFFVILKNLINFHFCRKSCISGPISELKTSDKSHFHLFMINFVTLIKASVLCAHNTTNSRLFRSSLKTSSKNREINIAPYVLVRTGRSIPGEAGHAEQQGDGEQDIGDQAHQDTGPVDLQQLRLTKGEGVKKGYFCRHFRLFPTKFENCLSPILRLMRPQ